MGVTGYLSRNHPATCSGDQSCDSFLVTTLLSLGTDSRRHGRGRSACFHARSSEREARYPVRPRLRASSLLTVDGARPIDLAIPRIDIPAAMPLEISSRSSLDSARLGRRRMLGRIPPCKESNPWIEPGGLPTARPISLSDSPSCHRRQTSSFFQSESPGRPSRAI